MKMMSIAYFLHWFLILSFNNFFFLRLVFHALFAKRHFEKLMMYEYVRIMYTLCIHWHAVNWYTEQKETQHIHTTRMKDHVSYSWVPCKEFICSTTCYLNDKWTSALGFLCWWWCEYSFHVTLRITVSPLPAVLFYTLSFFSSSIFPPHFFSLLNRLLSSYHDFETRTPFDLSLNTNFPSLTFCHVAFLMFHCMYVYVHLLDNVIYHYKRIMPFFSYGHYSMTVYEFELIHV